MAWWNKSKQTPQSQVRTQSTSTAGGSRSEPVAVSSTDWADPEAVLAEWRNSNEPPNWGNAWSMFDEGPIPAQQLNVAEYFTRKLKTVLLGTDD